MIITFRSARAMFVASCSRQPQSDTYRKPSFLWSLFPTYLVLISFGLAPASGTGDCATIIRSTSPPDVPDSREFHQRADLPAGRWGHGEGRSACRRLMILDSGKYLAPGRDPRLRSMYVFVGTWLLLQRYSVLRFAVITTESYKPRQPLMETPKPVSTTCRRNI